MCLSYNIDIVHTSKKYVYTVSNTNLNVYTRTRHSKKSHTYKGAEGASQQVNQMALCAWQTTRRSASRRSRYEKMQKFLGFRDTKGSINPTLNSHIFSHLVSAIFYLFYIFLLSLFELTNLEYLRFLLIRDWIWICLKIIWIST